MKRVMDLLLSAAALVVLAPLMGLISILIRRESGPPVVFKQERVGRRGRSFTLYKFRTMRSGGTGPLITVGNDTRVTPIGRVLRKSKTDELPQLWNVVKGDMSLVGPRPEVRRYVEAWPADAREVILSVRPGITDPVTLDLRHEESLLQSVEDPEAYYLTTLLPSKVRGYVNYVQNRSLVGDVGILVRTLREIGRRSAGVVPVRHL